ncbi:Ser/Thr protein phosphatase, putative [Trichomonas vaginalis G3]|uniref:Ser/Thr protein phosphatase, putative n=1 Tax=Trichomonas vaginalis (strain ATCC PRA-98 / G3) TaxID=412133 RepID=A2FDU3_TRIV3|nr:Ser/Thr protein phosphatase, putative [Trichomonas vaginalis G3]|eukprot:XP_001309872.1 Ser/Thr protein phosphatase [Trichomonas vaginalis G3]
MNWKAHCGRYCSFFPYYLIFVFVFLGIFIRKYKYTVDKVILNSDYVKFNDSEDPTIIGHLTDIHISDFWPDDIKWFKNNLLIFKEQIKPTFTLITGDMVDNYYSKNIPGDNGQIEDQWKQYNQTLSSIGFKNEELFIIYGNHDVYDLVDMDDFQKIPIKYSNISPDYSFSKERGNVRIISFNPHALPNCVGPQGYSPPILAKHVDALEKEFEKPSDKKYTILTSHYPHEMFIPDNAKSKKGNKYTDLMKKYKVTAFVNGHSHPDKVEIVHFADTIEITGLATKVFGNFSLISIDNGRLNYQTYDPEKNKGPYAIVTSPNPSHISAFNFPDQEFPIRIVSFDKSKARNFVVSGDAKGKLGFVRYLNTDKSVALYQMNAKFDTGIHKIQISGDMTETVTFAVNCDSGPFEEVRKHPYNPYSGIVGFPLLFLFSFIIILCMWIPMNFVQNSADYIVGKGSSHCWLCIIFLGPLVYGRSLGQLEIWIKVFLTFIIVWNICLPICFYHTNTKTSMLWAWGYVVNGYQVFDAFSVFLAGISMMVFMPVILLAGSVYLVIKNDRWRRSQFSLLLI